MNEINLDYVKKTGAILVLRNPEKLKLQDLKKFKNRCTQRKIKLYIANNINILIKKNLKVKFLEVDFWVNFGDVHDFNSYIYWQNFFSETNYLKL